MSRPETMRPLRIFAASALLSLLLLQVVELASLQLQPSLNSDYLLAHVICREFTAGPYPADAWKFGMGTFLFPDYALFLPWYASAGDEGWSYAGYACTIWAGYAAASAWVLTAVGVTRFRAAVGALLGLNLLLLCRHAGGDHAARLWQLSIPAYHGGNILIELTLLGLILRAVRDNAWTAGARRALIAVGALGVFSNALALLHVLLPALLALAPAVRCDPTPAARELFRRYARALLAIIGFVVLLRVALALGEIFLFAKLFKAWPLPHLIFDRLTRCLADWRESVFGLMPIFGGLIVAGMTATLLDAFRTARTIRTEAQRLLLLAGLAVFFVPVVAVYWNDAGSFRYHLPLLILAPLAILIPLLAGSAKRFRFGAIAATALLTALLALHPPKPDREKLVFPKSEQALALRRYLREQKLESGLCHFWENYRLQAEWRFDGPRLANIRDEDFCEFWCNNAYSYFPVNKSRFGQPKFDFVIVNRLDAGILRARLGGEITPVWIGGYGVARLDARQSEAAAALVRSQVESILQGRRAERLREVPR